ncbi:MAG: type II secretion system protein [Patescibacteria group bacterium]
MENKLFKKKNKGFSLVEVLVYMGILTMVVAILVGSLTVMAKAQEKITAGRAVGRSASVALDRVLREVRLSDSIDSESSLLDDSESILVLNREEESGDISITFYVSANGHLYVVKEGIGERLTHKKTDIQEFRVIEAGAGSGSAVRIELEIACPYSDGKIEQAFYSTAILRGSYE